MPVLKLPFLLACTAALLITAGCGSNHSDSIDTSPADGATLRWGADENGSAPYLYRDPANPSKQIGFEKEIAEELGKRLDREMEFVQTPWDSLLPALNRGDFDIALSGIEITPVRQEQVAFSNPYYITTKQLVVRAADSGIKSLDDLTDRPVGTLMESTSEKYLRNTRCEVRTYDNSQLPYDDLLNGTVDGVMLDLPIAEFYTRSNKGLRMAGEPIGPGQYGIAIRQKDQKLLNEVNAALASMKEDGSLQVILEKWNLWNSAQEPTTTTVVATAH